MDNNYHPQYKKEIDILNANVGLTNIVDFYDDKTSDIIISTLTNIIDTLEPIYGKDALYNLLIFDYHISKFSTNVFTNDGINSISNIDFISPIQKYIANYIVYLGKRVELKAFDGTTTSMLFATYLLGHIYTKLMDIKHNNKKYKEQSHWKRLLNEVSNHVSTIMDKLQKDLVNYVDKMENDSFEEINKKLYRLLMITTKGNHELSNILSDLASKVPREIMDTLFYRKSKIETDKAFTVINKDEDYSHMVSGFNKTLYNDPLSIKYHNDDIDIIIYPGILDGCNPSRMEMIEKLLSYHNENRDNKILLITLSCSHQLATSMMDKYPKLITASYSTVESPLIQNPLELNALRVLSDAKSIISDIQHKSNVPDNITNDEYSKYVLTNKEVKIDTYSIKYYKLYKSQYKYIHPFYYNQNEHQEYKNLLESLHTQLTELKSNHSVEMIKDQYNAFQMLYRNMITYKLPIIEIGGSTLDLLANIDLIEDAKGVLISALDNGIIDDGIYKMFYYVDTEIKNETTSDILEAYTIVKDSIYSTLQSLLELQISSINSIDKKIDINKMYELGINGNTCKMIGTSDIEPIWQSYSTYSEMIKRVKEIIPKLIKTSKIIIPDAVNMNKEENKDAR